MSVPAWNSCEYILKIRDIQSTLRSLEENLIVSRNLQAEQWLRYSMAKSKNRTMIDDLKRAHKSNRNMLNLFRESVTNARLGIGISLPEPLNREVQRTWHEKYDALLAKNDQLRKEALTAQLRLERKNREIDELQSKLSSFADCINKQDLAIKDMTSKYLRTKKRTQEQDVLLRQSSRLPQITRFQNPLLEREIQCNNRLTFENTRLGGLLRERKLARNNVTFSNKIS